MHAGDPRYNPDADFNNDNHVDMRDIMVIAGNYGKNRIVENARAFLVCLTFHVPFCV